VDGRLQTRSWVAQDGSKRSVVEIVADNIDTLERRPDGEGAPGGEIGEAAPERAPVAAAAGNRRSSAPAPPPDDDLDESDPFADE
jgi:single-stranded DNA-binding protein